jgi:glucokinase
VGIAGLVDWRAGVFTWGPHVAGTDVPVGRRLEEEFGVPAVVDNDANMAAVAEHRLGAGRGFAEMLLVTVGTGIGGAVISDGRLIHGRRYAGEWGHVRFGKGDVACRCGRLGCWETEVSGPALARTAADHVRRHPEGSLASQAGGRAVTGELVTAAAIGGDAEAAALLRRLGEALGAGLADLIAMFDPEVIVIGGGLGSVGEPLVDPARRVVTERLHGAPWRRPPEIRAAQLGERANAIGAALVAADATGG